MTDKEREQEARDQAVLDYADDYLEIDAGAEVSYSRSASGCWVQAWVWVPLSGRG